MAQPALRSKMPTAGITIFSRMSSLALQYNALNLGQGFPGFAIDPALGDLVGKYIREGHNQYAPMPGIEVLRRRISEKIHANYGHAYDPGSEITITAGGTQAIFTAITAFVHPGDEVILFAPAYDCYAPAVEINGGIHRWVSLSYPDYTVDWTQVASLVNKKTRMIIINTPHNPSGTCFSGNDMQELARIVGGTDIVVLSDEVYEHIVFDGLHHESAMKFPSLRDRSIIVYSFGKTFHATGWKMGYAVGPERLMNEFRKVHQYNVFSCFTPGQYALAEYMEDRSTWETLSSFYQDKRDAFIHLMEGSRFGIVPVSGTYFQLLDYSQVSGMNDVEFAEHLTREHRLATIPLSVFYPAGHAESGNGDKVLRICFAKETRMLEQAAAILSSL